MTSTPTITLDPSTLPAETLAALIQQGVVAILPATAPAKKAVTRKPAKKAAAKKAAPKKAPAKALPINRHNRLAFIAQNPWAAGFSGKQIAEAVRAGEPFEGAFYAPTGAVKAALQAHSA